MDATPSAKRRLLGAAREVLNAHGAVRASARTIADAAGMSASAVNYHFGSLEQMFDALAETCVEEVRAWIRRCATELTDLPVGPAGAAYALRHLILSWTEDRARALFYAEVRARAQTEARVGPALAGEFRALFLSLEAMLGLRAPAGAMMHAFFESEALFHLSRWRPALEAAALGELVDCLVRVWIGRGEAPAAECPALRRAIEASSSQPQNAPPAALRLGEAAVEVVSGLGLEGLTHRAVAARAGVTAGAVAHYFTTAEDLLAGALRGQVDALMREVGAARAAPPSLEVFSRRYIERAGEPGAPAPVSGRQRLFLAAVRRSELAAAGATIRFVHGGTTSRMLSGLIGERPDSAAIAAILSLLMSSLWRAGAGDRDGAAGRRAIAAYAVAKIAEGG